MVLDVVETTITNRCVSGNSPHLKSPPDNHTSEDGRVQKGPPRWDLQGVVHAAQLLVTSASAARWKVTTGRPEP